MYKLNTKNKTYSAGFFLCLFCSFFSINGLMLNPVYLIGVPVVCISFILINFKSLDRFYFFYIVYFLVSFSLFGLGLLYFEKYVLNYEIVYFSSFLYLYCILLGGATVFFGLQVDKNKRLELYLITYNVLIIFMGLDLAIRFLMAASNGNFYDYKWGLFYYDSNFTGLIILLFIMFSLFLKINNILDIGKLRFILLLFFLFFTFSRAAIFAFIVSYLLLRFARKFIFFISTIFSIISVYIFYKMISLYISGKSFVDLDGSFNSKFYFISVAIDNYVDLPTINKIFGIGLANFQYYSDGFFAHNILITFFYEFGYAGILFFTIFMWISFLKIGKDVLYIYIPFFIAGFSLFSAYMPFFFVLIACLYIEKKSH